MVDFVFLDSGTGGIPYLIHLMETVPNASCVYVGDTVNFPYGEKSHDEIVSCVLKIVKKIIDRFSPKVIVIACNTMSVNALDVLREAYSDVQFVGTVPAIKVAGEISKKRCIGLLATTATCKHSYNMDLKNHFASDCKMILRGDAELISFIEHESFTATIDERKNACRPAVDFFRKQGCDVIILGCTHFLNLKEEMQSVANPDITIVDSVDGVTKRAISVHGGVAGVSTAEGIAQNTAVTKGNEEFEAQGETSPSKSSLFITGFYDKKDEKEYDVICKRFDLLFGGVL